MALPASQYSVLDGNQVERLSDDTFRVFVEGFNFFSFKVHPILTLQVQTMERGCIISMLACKLKGSKLVEAQNTQFRAHMRNQGALLLAHFAPVLLHVCVLPVDDTACQCPSHAPTEALSRNPCTAELQRSVQWNGVSHTKPSVRRLRATSAWTWSSLCHGGLWCRKASSGAPAMLSCRPS